MPLYTFRCPQCGIFEKMIRMNQLTNTIPCPSCTRSSFRVYTPPGLLFTPNAIRKRMENSIEPKRIQKEALPVRKKHIHHHSYHPQRPWQVGH